MNTDSKTLALGDITLTVRPNGVAVVSFDCRNGKVNLFSPALMVQLEQVVSKLEQPGFCRGVVFCSGKPDFFYGVDVAEIAQAQEKPADTTYAACQTVKILLARIENLPITTVVAIHGKCIGGGLEFSLACKKRLASSSKTTVIGFPEEALGVLPGWGGTVRATKQLGFLQALRIIFSPMKPWSARRAHKHGLVDGLHEEADLLEAACALATVAPGEPREKSLLRKITDTVVGRAVVTFLSTLIFKVIMRGYPAPKQTLLVVNCVFDNAARGLPESEVYAMESRKFSELCLTPISKRNVQTFLRRQAAKRASKAS